MQILRPQFYETWRSKCMEVKNILLNNEYVDQKIKEETKKNAWKEMQMKTLQSRIIVILQSSELCDPAKAILRGKYILIQT